MGIFGKPGPLDSVLFERDDTLPRGDAGRVVPRSGGLHVTTPIQRILARARVRLACQRFLASLVLTVTVAGLALLALRILERGGVLTLAWQPATIWAGAGAVLCSLIWVLARLPRREGVARIVDDAAGLKESLSTALSVEGDEDPWSRATVADAVRKARGVSLGAALPFRGFPPGCGGDAAVAVEGRRGAGPGLWRRSSGRGWGAPLQARSSGSVRRGPFVGPLFRRLPSGPGRSCGPGSGLVGQARPGGGAGQQAQRSAEAARRGGIDVTG